MSTGVNTQESLLEHAPDSELVGRLTLRDQRALVELYRRHARRLYPLIRRIVTNEGLAEEILQDVFVRLWTRASLYRAEEGQLLAWLITMARNLALDALRKDSRWRGQLEFEESLHEGSPAERLEPDVDTTLSVRHALSTLPDDQRRAVELAYFAGMTHAELAAHLNQPLGTVKSRLQAGARQAARRPWAGPSGEDGAMIQPCHHFDAEWDLLVLGTLGAERSAEMRAHAAGGCARCQERLRAALRLMESIGAALEPADPPAHVEARLQQRLRALEADPGSSRGAPPRRPAGARDLIVRLAAVAALVACGVLLWRDLGQRREIAALRARAERGPAAAPPEAPRPTASQPEAKAPPAPTVSAEAAREWALERSRLQASIAEANTSRTRAETEAARWRDELARLRSAASSAPAVPDGPPPPVTDPRLRGDELREEVARLAAEVRRLEAQGGRETSRARAYASALQLALDAGSRRAALRAVDRAAGGATASALLASDGRLILTTRDLPPLGSDKCYQLWIIRRDTPAVVSGGVLNDVSSGQVVHIARVDGRPDLVTGFAITDEPAGGSESSRGRKLLFGAVQ